MTRRDDKTKQNAKGVLRRCTIIVKFVVRYSSSKEREKGSAVRQSIASIHPSHQSPFIHPSIPSFSKEKQRKGEYLRCRYYHHRWPNIPIYIHFRSQEMALFACLLACLLACYKTRTTFALCKCSAETSSAEKHSEQAVSLPRKSVENGKG
jgi:hypothetical protein